MRRIVFAALAGSLAVTGIAGLVFYGWQRPTVLRVAVSSNSDSIKLVNAVALALARDSKNIRFKIMPMEDFVASSAALESGAVDLSVVRSDIAMPPNGQTLAILYREAVVLMAPAGSKLTRVAALQGQRVGVLKARITGMGNGNLLSIVLGQYAVLPTAITPITLLPEDVARAVRDHEIDALMAVGVPSGGVVGDAVAAMTQNGGGPPVFIPISEASAIAQRSPIFEAREIVAGAFGGSPQRPVENLDTLGITVRLMARSGLSDDVAADVVRHLFAVRPRIAVTLPLANRIEAPATDKGQALPTHPGAAAYFDGDEQSFLERNSDFIYLGAMFISIIGSGLAAFASRLGMHNHAQFDAHMQRLLQLMNAARKAGDAATLDAIEEEADEILATTLAGSGAGELEGHRGAAFTVAFDRLCANVRDRRGIVGTGHPGVA